MLAVSVELSIVELSIVSITLLRMPAGAGFVNRSAGVARVLIHGIACSIADWFIESSCSLWV